MRIKVKEREKSMLRFWSYLEMYIDTSEKEITNHSNMLACRIPWTEEHCGLQSMGSQKAGCDWSHSAWHITWENTPLPWLVLGVTNQVNAGTIPYFAWSVTNQAPGAGHRKYKRKPNGKKRTKGDEYRSQVVESMVQGLIFERKKKKKQWQNNS